MFLRFDKRFDDSDESVTNIVNIALIVNIVVTIIVTVVVAIVATIVVTIFVKVVIKIVGKIVKIASPSASIVSIFDIFLLAKQNDNSRYGERFEDEDMEQMMKDADLDRLVVLSFLIFHFEKEFLFLLSYSERLVVLTF